MQTHSWHCFVDWVLLGKQFVKDGLTKDEPLALRNIPSIDDPEKRIDLKHKFNLGPNEFLMVQSGNIYQDDVELEQTFRTVLSIPNLHWGLIGSNERFKRVEAQFILDSRYNERIHFELFDQERLYPMLRACDFGYLYTQSQPH